MTEMKAMGGGSPKEAVAEKVRADVVYSLACVFSSTSTSKNRRLVFSTNHKVRMAAGLWKIVRKNMRRREHGYSANQKRCEA